MPNTEGIAIEHLTSAIADLEDATVHLNNYAALFDNFDDRMHVVEKYISPVFNSLAFTKAARQQLMNEAANGKS